MNPFSIFKNYVIKPNIIFFFEYLFFNLLFHDNDVV